MSEPTREGVAATTRTVRLVQWLSADARISRFHLGLLFLACVLFVIRWLVYG